MNPTPEQVAQWAQWGAAQHGHTIKWTDEIRETVTSIVTRAMAEQAEADAKLCDESMRGWLAVAKDDNGSNGCYDFKSSAAHELASVIRANAPKVTT